MPTQRDLFDQRYKHIAATDRAGWSDEETIATTIQKIQEITTEEPKTFLELGCGRGNIALAFAEQWPVTGIDFSPAAIQWANQLAVEQNKKATFIEGDLTQPWSIGNAAFDLTFDANCLHFFHGDDRQHFMREAHRVLKPGGMLILDTIVNQPNEEHWKLLGYDPLTKASYRDGVAMNYYTDIPELFDLVTNNGFTITSTEFTISHDDHIWLVATKLIG